MSTIKAQPITAQDFAPFGELLTPREAPTKMINAGRWERHHALATVERSGGEAILSIFRSEPVSLPYDCTLLERHPLGSQAFIPLLGNPFLIVVAPVGDAPVSGLVRAFRSNGRQGVNYHRGVWHHPVLTIEKRDDFLVVDRSGSGNNCDEHFFKEDQLLFLAPHQ